MEGSSGQMFDFVVSIFDRLPAIREILGAGTLFGYAVFGPDFSPMTFMVKPPGAFVCLGLLLGVMNIIKRGRV